MNSWLRMKTCSCMSTWPRSAVPTGPRTVSMLGMAGRYADVPPLSAAGLSAGEIEEAREVVAHHRLDLILSEVLELAEVRLRFGQALAVGEVGAEHDRLDADGLDDAVDV